MTTEEAEKYFGMKFETNMIKEIKGGKVVVLGNHTMAWWERVQTEAYNEDRFWIQKK